MIISTVKVQLDGSNVIEIPLKSSWYTGLKYPKPYIFISQKVKKPPDEFSLISSLSRETILLLFCLILHNISRLLKVNPNWIWVTTIKFSRKKYRARTCNSNSSNLSKKAIKNPPKFHTKNISFVFCTMTKDKICHILSSRVEYSEQVGFDSDG